MKAQTQPNGPNSCVDHREPFTFRIALGDIGQVIPSEAQPKSVGPEYDRPEPP
jgi:hypothetical protein